jgi:hypothetical protein
MFDEVGFNLLEIFCHSYATLFAKFSIVVEISPDFMIFFFLNTFMLP